MSCQVQPHQFILEVHSNSTQYPARDLDDYKGHKRCPACRGGGGQGLNSELLHQAPIFQEDARAAYCFNAEECNQQGAGDAAESVDAEYIQGIVEVQLNLNNVDCKEAHRAAGGSQYEGPQRAYIAGGRRDSGQAGNHPGNCAKE